MQFSTPDRLWLSKLLGISMLILLTLSLAACTSPFTKPVQSGGPNAAANTAPTQAVTVAPTPTPFALQVVNCPSTLAVKWDALVGTQPGVDKVQKVTCGSLEASNSLDAVVAARYYSPNQKLDVYVYDNLTGTPTQRFKLTGLLDGDAQISPSGTLITAQIGTSGVPSQTPNVFREYQWNNSTFVQVLSPYLYPDMTHYQAEQDQAYYSAQVAANRPVDAWKASPAQEAEHMAQDVFFWKTVSKTVLKFSQTQDLVTIQITNLGTGGGGFIASFHHLDGNPKNIYEASSVTGSDNVTSISSPSAGAQVTNPMSITGTTMANGRILGQVIVYDDLYTKVGLTDNISSPVASGLASFTGSVSFALSEQGLQEGVVAFYATNQNNTAYRSQVAMVKVFLSA